MVSKTPIIAADAKGLERAARILAQGGLVAVPTETVYGLAARADRDDAVQSIYKAKGRPDNNPLIVHVACLDEAQSFAEFSPEAQTLAKQYWPGPLTLVLPRKAGAPLAHAVSAGLPTLALRVPAHPAMRALLELCDFPLAAPSANRSGFISPTSAQHVAASLDGRVDLILDGGPCETGLESTIIAVRESGDREILRPGALFAEQSVAVTSAGIEAPGQLSRHYAPGKPLRLFAKVPADDEFMIGFGPIKGDCNLSGDGDLSQAAQQLYACLHLGALAGAAKIAIAPIPETGIGVAINDRLRRAAR